jgi:hypothetical protein
MHLKSITFPLTLASAAVLLIAPAAVTAASVPSKASVYPPPGLYRVDTDGKARHNDGELPALMQHTVQDGASGSVRITGGRANEAQVTKDYAGDGVVKYCMPALPLSGALPVARGCKASAGVTAPGSLNYITLCGGLKMNTTISKIDEKTWEYKIVSTESGAPVTGQMNFAGTRAVLAAQAKNGATAAERAKAAGLLAQMGTYESEMKKAAAQLAEARAELAQDGVTPEPGHSIERTSIHRLTRIAGTCSAPNAR